MYYMLDMLSSENRIITEHSQNYINFVQQYNFPSIMNKQTLHMFPKGL